MIQLSCGIVIYNELKYLKNLIPQLKQELEFNEVEWIFILNNESHLVRLEIAQWLNQQLSTALIFENPSNNLGQARQTILENAKNNLTYFIDPDVSLKPGSLIELLRISRNQSNNLIGYGGPLEYQSTNLFLDKTFKFINLISKFYPFAFQMQSHSQPKQVDHLPTCHLLLNRKLALLAGGFSTQFTTCGEDLDFSHRVRAFNFSFLFCPTAPVVHLQNLSLQQWIVKMMTYGRIQIFTQKINLKNGFRFYRILPLIALVGFGIILIVYPLITTGLMLIGSTGLILIPGGLGAALTALAYALGELFETIAPTFERQNEVVPPAIRYKDPETIFLAKTSICPALINWETH